MNLRKYFSGLVLFCLISIQFVSQSEISLAQTNKTSENKNFKQQKAFEQRKEIKHKGFFYEVKSDSTTLYILGSIHLGKKEWYPMDKAIENAFTTSDFLVTEINLNEINPLEVADYLTIKDNSTLESKLKPKNYEKLKNSLIPLGVPETMLQKMRPWFAGITYQTLTSQKEMPLDMEYGVDKYFTEKANDTKKPIEEIETVKQQIEILTEFDKFPDDLIEMSDLKSDTTENQTKLLVEAWENGDDDAINQMINQVNDEFPNLKSLMFQMITQRNKNMELAISNYLNTKKKYFIVIGAGHLVGENSIINRLLKENKYKIRRLL